MMGQVEAVLTRFSRTRGAAGVPSKGLCHSCGAWAEHNVIAAWYDSWRGFMGTPEMLHLAHRLVATSGRPA